MKIFSASIYSAILLISIPNFLLSQDITDLYFKGDISTVPDMWKHGYLGVAESWNVGAPDGPVSENKPTSTDNLWISGSTTAQSGFVTGWVGDMYFRDINFDLTLSASSFDLLSNIENQTINSLLHLSRGIFGADFGSSSAVISNTKNPAAVIRASESRRARPMSKLEYFFRIMATISVPPLEAPMLKRIAEPSAGRAMAKQSSSMGWSVSGPLIGQIRSITERATDSRILQYAVLAANFFPSMTSPITRRIMLMIRLKSPADMTPVRAMSTARPVTPPNVKLFVNLKK